MAIRRNLRNVQARTSRTEDDPFEPWPSWEEVEAQEAEAVVEALMEKVKEKEREAQKAARDLAEKEQAAELAEERAVKARDLAAAAELAVEFAEARAVMEKYLATAVEDKKEPEDRAGGENKGPTREQLLFQHFKKNKIPPPPPGPPPMPSSGPSRGPSSGSGPSLSSSGPSSSSSDMKYYPPLKSIDCQKLASLPVQEQYSQRSQDHYQFSTEVCDFGQYAGRTSAACFWLCLAAGLAECREGVLAQALPGDHPASLSLAKVRARGVLAYKDEEDHRHTWSPWSCWSSTRSLLAVPQRRSPRGGNRARRCARGR